MDGGGAVLQSRVKNVFLAEQQPFGNIAEDKKAASLAVTNLGLLALLLIPCVTNVISQLNVD